nr:hypothetical protein [Mucilaginibacter sp. L294]
MASESEVKIGMRQWKEAEQRYVAVFSTSILNTRELLKDKLKHYEKVHARVIASSSNREQFGMRVFHSEKRKLEKQLYPSAIRQILNRILRALTLNRKVAKVRKEAVVNGSDICNALSKAGLGNYYQQVQNQMKQGNREFSLPVSYHVNEHEKMFLQMNFKKDDDNKYHFESYNATLHSDLEKGGPRKHMFSMLETEAYDTNKAYQLLAGRAVQAADGRTWSQFDFNDKEANGNYRHKNFPQNYGFDLEKAVRELPLRDSQMDRLLEQLRSGEKVAVAMSVNNKEAMYSISADPHKREMAVYDETGLRINKEQLKAGGIRKSNVKQLIPKNSSEQQESKVKSLKVR